ncbi:hypothetical protein C8Q74DRAFT_1373488 [Fomes fomentarius]|nr:hypothetical protein C8Q74DRAFT_1373488 [Fomes fomentarius]
MSSVRDALCPVLASHLDVSAHLGSILNGSADGASQETTHRTNCIGTPNTHHPHQSFHAPADTAYTCALFMLALEAELSSSLPNAGVFAQALGRSKVAKRVVVARGLKDVVQDDIWRKQIESGGRPVLQLDIHSKDGEASGDEWERCETAGSTSACQATRTPSTGARFAKKVRTRHARSVVHASHFLLNPLATSVHPRSSTTESGPPDLLTHLLTADAASLPHAFARAPTRLQLLASERGGKDKNHIADDELFAEDELEGALPKTLRLGKKWKRGEEKDGHEGTGKTCGSKKIDMDALARLLDPDADLGLDSVSGDFGAAGDGHDREEDVEQDHVDGEATVSTAHNPDRVVMNT